MTQILPWNALVYALVRAIPRGRVLSYGRVSKLLGVPHGARSVGWALSALPARLEPEVPWHRVVNAQGRISIKGAPEAALEQRRRLEAEGVVFDDQDTLNFALYLWEPTPPEIEQVVAEVRSAQERRAQERRAQDRNAE